MIVFLTIVGFILSFMVTFALHRKIKNNTLIKGWSWEAVPDGTRYHVTIKDPENNQWGHRGYDTKIPVMIDPRLGSRSNTWHTWNVSNPRWIKYNVVKCARKHNDNERLAARQKVAGTF